jgi:hypothetical protein
MLFSAFAISPAFAVDPTGVEQCDALLKRYEACSSQLPPKQVHAAQKEMIEGMMSIRAASADPKLRPELERFCAERFELMKKTGDLAACMSRAAE